jgi:hypothetical protein
VIAIDTALSYARRSAHNANDRHDRHDRHTKAAAGRDTRDDRDGRMHTQTVSEKFEFRPELSAEPSRKKRTRANSPVTCGYCGEPVRARDRWANGAGLILHNGCVGDYASASRDAELAARRVNAPAFVPTSEWQDVPADAVLPPGLQVEMDVTTGRNRARLHPNGQDPGRASDRHRSHCPRDGD